MDKKYKVLFARSAEKCFKKIDKSISRLILAWLNKNIEGCEDPRRYGKALLEKSDIGGNDYSNKWRYRVGDIRIICDINDENVTVLVIKLAHRSKVYK